MAQAGGLTLSPDARLLVLHPSPDFDFAGRVADVVQPFRPFHDALVRAKHTVSPDMPAGPYDAVVVCATRSKAQTKDLIAQACALAPLVVVDGQKTDGIDSHFKAVRSQASVEGNITKAHGRLFWFAAQPFAAWHDTPKQLTEGFVTRAGVFSADGPDSASKLLIQALPQNLGSRLADLGAGWGYLARDILRRDTVTSLHLVEADATALDCAKVNIDDERASFHWADATNWSGLYDTVVMNPPFHQSRKGEPALGKGFIATAAKCLTPSGTLWMVANRHLPYETALTDAFAQVEEKSGTGAFKIFMACRPKRKPRIET